jgi:hypothetical protein
MKKLFKSQKKPKPLIVVYCSCALLPSLLYRHESWHGSVNYEQENHQSVSETYCEVEVMSEFIGLANRKGENIFIKSMK